MARPTKLTEEVAEKIYRAIRAGNYPAIAARSAGVGESTFYRWMEEGRSIGSGPKRDFYEAVRKAEADAEALAVALVAKAGSKDWRAAMSLLERRSPERWRRHERAEGPLEERPTVDLSVLSKEELGTYEQLTARISKPA